MVVDELLKDLEQGPKPHKKEEEEKPKEKKPKEGKEYKSKIPKGDIRELTIRFNMRMLERFAYWLIIAVLLVFIIYNSSLFGEKSWLAKGSSESKEAEALDASKQETEVKSAQEEKAKTETPKKNETKDAKEEPKEETAPVAQKTEQTEQKTEEPEPALSGKIKLEIVSINKEKVDDDLGEISEVVFTIENEKDKVLYPYVTASAFDSSWDAEWHAKSRGEFTYPKGIGPGEKVNGIIKLSPKTFRDLELEKTIILYLRDKDETGDVLTTVTINFMIE